jgi:hypothetical protein
MSVRKAAVAGTFYPSDPTRLNAEVHGYLSAAVRCDLEIEPRMVIVPHAGYIYSGPTAAFAYRCVEDLSLRRVVMIGPSHYVPFVGLALPDANAMETPLGVIDIDQSAVEGLLANPAVVVSAEAHRREHSLEVQLPFLQVVAPDVAVVPVLTGAVAPAEAADAVAPLLDEGTLLLISSDLSHYYDAVTARSLDAATAAAIIRLDGAALGRESACGRTAVQIALELAKRFRYRVMALDMRNSGDTAGPADRVVGYGAFALGA